MERSLSCPTCGAAVERDARFCNGCGTHLELPTDPERAAVERDKVPTLTRNAIDRRPTRKLNAVKRRKK